MTTRIAAVLAAGAAIIAAVVLLFVPVHATVGASEAVTCGQVLSADTQRAQAADQMHGLVDGGFQAACANSLNSREGWSIGLGAAGVLVGAAAVVLFARRPKPVLAGATSS